MAMRTQSILTAAAIALTMPLAACASGVSGEGYGASGYSNAGVEASYSTGYVEKHATGYIPEHATGYIPEHATGYIPARNDDGLLPEPPANAKAGQCFAKVVVPGQQVYGPPSGPHLKWVQSPPPPGAIGPVWCQIWDAGYEPTVLTTPERYGWIRVICDKDATAEKIGHVQHRLHDWGYYNGQYGGQYDAATSEAVKRFQSERHIEHGGYLSYRTMETLDESPPAPAPQLTYAQGSQGGYQGGGFAFAQQGYAPQPCGGPCQPPAPPVYPAPVYQAPVYPGPVYQAPVYQAPVYAQPAYNPCGPAPCQVPVPQPCGPAPCQGGYGQGGYGGYGQGSYQHARNYSVQSQGRF